MAVIASCFTDNQNTDMKDREDGGGNAGEVMGT